MSGAIALRPYQLEAVAAIQQAEGRGVRRPLIALPTGTGKTIVFAELIRQRPGRALVLAHRDELIQQAADKIRLVHPAARLGIVKAERDEREAPIVVASVQTLSRPSRLARLSPDFTTVVVDEAHHGTADTYQRILDSVGSLREDGPLTLGVTATPERGDGIGLDAVWQEIVYQAEILPMIQAGYLCDLRGLQVSLSLNLDRVHVRAGDYVVGELDDALLAANAPRHAVEAYQAHAAGRKALVFTPGVALAHQMAGAFRAAGLAAEALDGSTEAADRRAILARLRCGETRIVCNCAVLTEGFDEPSLDCIVVCRPTQSRPFYVQMIGRCTRTWPGKADCLVLDLVGNTSRHDIQTAATLFGLAPGALENETVSEAIDHQRELAAEQDAHGRLVAKTVDLFHRRRLNWVASGPMRYALSIGDGLLLLLTEDLTRWRVEHRSRDRQRVVLAEGLDLGFAQGTAEDYARKVGAGILVNRDATWRQAPATDGQIEALRRCRIRFAPTITKGEASDLITAAVAGRCAE